MGTIKTVGSEAEKKAAQMYRDELALRQKSMENSIPEAKPKGFFGTIRFLVGALLLVLVKLTFNVTLAVTAFISRTRHRTLYLPLNTSQGHSQVATLKDCSEHLRKVIPKHICIAVMDDKALSFEDIANIAVWCYSLGVKFTTFYDVAGVLKRNENTLRNEIAKKLLEYRLPKSIIEFVNEGENVRYKDSKNITFAKVLSIDDGQAMVSDVVSELMNEIIGDQQDSHELKLSDLESKLLVAGNSFPDPECVLCFGFVSSTLGLIPWQLDHSELIKVESHVGILPSQFIESLERYTKIEKRFGR